MNMTNEKISPTIMQKMSVQLLLLTVVMERVHSVGKLLIYLILSSSFCLNKPAIYNNRL